MYKTHSEWEAAAPHRGLRLALSMTERAGRVWEGGDVCVHVANACCCRAEMGTTLYSDYLPILKNKNNKYEKKILLDQVA